MTSCSLLCFFFLLQILVIVQSKTCPVSSCGKITNISHPFRLKDYPATCGDPAYELTCENNSTLLLSLFPDKNGNYYHVKAINYNKSTVRVVDPGIQEGDCSSIPRYFLSYPNFTIYYDSEGFYSAHYSYTGFGYVIYLNCTNPVRDNPRYVDTAPCLLHNNGSSEEGSGGGGHLYAVAGDLLARDLNVDCHVKLVAVTSLINKYNYKPKQSFSYQEIHRMLVYGFELQWDTEGYCPSPLRFRYRCGFHHYQSPSFGHIVLGALALAMSKSTQLPKWRQFLEEVISGFGAGALRVIVALRVFQITYYYEPENSYGSKLGFKIGRVMGKYALPSYIIMRVIIGLIVLLGNWIYIYWKRHTSVYENIEDFLRENSLMPIRYSYKEIKNMTKGFKDKLGEGGYGTVYKGKLRSGPLVGVKMLSKPKASGQEFISEVATIGRIHHGNVVQLIGFCVEASKRALIYEFMPNGSLDKYISSKENDISLTYNQMYTIALGVARGIAYLHQGCDMQILHFDIKPHNILLDETFIPKVSDFGLAKLYPIDNSIVTLTAARGTIGYMAPELFYQNVGGVSYKADVYSFGMLLMEMANRRRNLNPYADNSSQTFLPLLVYDQLIEEREIEFGEATYEEKNNVKKMFIVALWCIQLRPDDRPSMDKVIEMLEGEVDSVIMPPKPSLYPTEIIQDSESSYDESISGDTSDSWCFLEDTT